MLCISHFRKLYLVCKIIFSQRFIVDEHLRFSFQNGKLKIFLFKNVDKK
jgi:hypothetical protein